jgi:hypothetical protein
LRSTKTSLDYDPADAELDAHADAAASMRHALLSVDGQKTKKSNRTMALDLQF